VSNPLVLCRSLELQLTAPRRSAMIPSPLPSFAAYSIVYTCILSAQLVGMYFLAVETTGLTLEE
jgi:hypothetical protein